MWSKAFVVPSTEDKEVEHFLSVLSGISGKNRSCFCITTFTDIGSNARVLVSVGSCGSGVKGKDRPCA
jgi:hypothetical protein